jgi:hypothetical protein
VRQLGYVLQLAAGIGGLIWGTITICAPVPNELGLVLWTISLVSLVRLLCLSPRKGSSRPPSFILRAAVAGIFMFFLVFLTAMGAAFAVNPGIPGWVDWTVLGGLGGAGVLLGLLAIKLSGG